MAANVSDFCSCPEELTFLLVTNMAGDKFPVAEQLYHLCGCRYVHIRLDKTAWPGWQWSYKVGGEMFVSVESNLLARVHNLETRNLEVPEPRAPITLRFP